jgi:hypothetical protein
LPGDPCIASCESFPWTGDRQPYWIARLDRQYPNVRAAVQFCLAEPDGAEGALRNVVALPPQYWWTGGLFTDGLGSTGCREPSCWVVSVNSMVSVRLCRSAACIGPAQALPSIVEAFPEAAATAGGLPSCIDVIDGGSTATRFRGR